MEVVGDIRSRLTEIREAGTFVLAVGLGITGIETARVLASAGIRVRVTERQAEADFRARAKYVSEVDALIAAGVEVCFGIDGEGVTPLLKDVRLCVISPGVSLESAIVGAIKRHQIIWIGELELGVHLFGGKSAIITGSNGKSTTVSLISALLRGSGVPVILCGNVGSPVISHLNQEQLLGGGQNSRDETLVVEASSYQLEGCSMLRPTVGVFLNLSHNHLERHGTMERYFAAKANLFARQEGADIAATNLDDEWGRTIVESMPAQLFGVFKSGGPGENWFEKNRQRCAGSARIQFAPLKGEDWVEIELDGKPERYELEGVPLLGLHNRYDIAFSLLVARSLGATAEKCAVGIRKFHPLEHRLETCLDTPELVVINDSKSTTVASTVAAVEAVLARFPERQLTLMIGGLSKAGTWEPVMQILERNRARLETVVCFGKDGHLLLHHVKQAKLPGVEAPSMSEGLDRARQAACPSAGASSVILLSPGCASFDEFRDFENRGDVFKSLVNA